MSALDYWGSDSRPRRRVLHITLGCAFLVAAMTTALVAQTPPQAVVAGRNVNMVSGTTWPTGDPFLQRQNEPSVAVSTRNPLHILAGANDYRTVDLPGLINDTETGDAWLGVFKSFDGGQRWQSTLIPGYPLDVAASPLRGYAAGADPVVRAGAHGLFLYSGLVFDRGDTGKSAIFVSRFIDNNNLEAGDPIGYIGTSIVTSDSGRTGRFLDKPWLAVDIPRGGSSTCSIITSPVAAASTGKGKGHNKPPDGQVIAAGAMYVAYTAITHPTSGIKAEILLSSSTNCGASWSAPVRLSRPQDPVNQGATIAINPVNGDVYVAWRRLTAPGATDSDAYLVARSTNQGRKFSNPGVARRFPRGKKKGLSLERYFEHQRMTEAHEVLDVAEFDQGTSADWLSFRTNAYPTMTFDGEGRLYLAWAERGFGTARSGEIEGDARIVMTTTRDGLVFTPPGAVDESGQAGHQIMPTLTYAGGRLLLVYYDLRQDVSQVFGPYIDDKSAIEVTQPDGTRRRHTIDIRATTAAPGDDPVFGPSTLVSEYAQGRPPDETGPARQLQHNVPNLPLFSLGTVPFVGDYIDVAAAPVMVQGSDGRWRYNTAASTAPVFHGVWTDNRDVRPPASRGPDGMPDWSKYTKPNGTSTVDPCQAGTRNQNIYTARLTTGLIAGSPGNTKPLTMDFPRSFVVFAQNTTEQLRYFRMAIVGQPPGGRASFLEYPVPPYTAASPPPLTLIDVAVPRRSLVARTVYVTSSDPHARINVNVAEIAALYAPAPLPNGLRSTVVLNPDISNPDISNPDISNPDISNPDISNAEVHNPDISNPDISNPDISNPDISNPDISNPDISNPDISNPDISNPDISNPDISNPDISNPDISNPDISNPDISNPDISNGTITDVTWTVTNNGNTTTAFDVDLFFSGLSSVPDGIKLQLILYRVYTTPIANGCDLKEQTHNVLVANVPNPVISPKPAAHSAAAGSMAAPDPNTPTLWIEPGGTAKITLRIVDTDRTDDVRLDPTEITPTTMAQPKNTEDLPNTSIEPPSATPKPAPTVPILAFTAQPVATPVGETMPPVIVSVMLGGSVPVPNVPVSLAFADNPAGAELTGTRIVQTDAIGLARFTKLQVTRAGTGFRFAASAGSTDAVPVLSALFDSQSASLVVTNTSDSGAGSLRQAILNANARAGVDVITFAIPGAGPFTIAPLSALPTITDPVTIDGTTQPGHTTGGPPVVEVRGNDTITEGFSVTGSGTTIRGLVINAFGYGIAVNGSSNLRVEGNYVGTDVAGTARVPNRLGGVFIWNSTNATIVGNLISGQGTIGLPARVDGMQISGCSGTRIQGNRIGTNAAATAALGNAGFGIIVSGTGTANTEITDNVISGNPFGGISIQMGAHGTIVQSNLIGTGTDTTVEIGNGRLGYVDGGGINISDSPDNAIGSELTTGMNTIAHNFGPGVFGYGAASTGNRILGNAIWHNGGMGVDLWGDYAVTANSIPETIGRQNFPVIASAYTTGGTTGVGGTLASRPNDSFRVEVFSNASCDGVGGNGEGAHLMGSFMVTTNLAGNATFTETFPSLPLGNVLTAMATRWSAGGSTSEFSACYTIPAAANPSGVGSTQPVGVTRGVPFHLIMNVTPGQNPTSTGLSVVVDASAIGLSSSLPLSDAGSMGGDVYGCDDIAGDNTFIGCATASQSTPYGVYVLPVTITDAQGRSTSSSITVTLPAVATGVITGTLVDGGGAVLPGVTVTLRDTATSVVHTTNTNGSGVFSFINLQSDIYEITSPVTRTGIVLHPGETLNLGLIGP